jgi:hypothetical protein
MYSLSKRYICKAAAAGPNMGIGLRLSSNAQNGYFLLPSWSTNVSTERVVQFKRGSGTYTILDNYTLPSGTFTSLSDGNFVHLEAETFGSTIRYKVWPDGTSEPSNWTRSDTDTSIAAAGYAGMYSGYTASQGTGDITIDDLLIRSATTTALSAKQ